MHTRTENIGMPLSVVQNSDNEPLLAGRGGGGEAFGGFRVHTSLVWISNTVISHIEE